MLLMSPPLTMQSSCYNTQSLLQLILKILMNLVKLININQHVIFFGWNTLNKHVLKLGVCIRNLEQFEIKTVKSCNGGSTLHIGLRGDILRILGVGGD